MLHNFNPETLQSSYSTRVIREQPNTTKAQVGQNLGAYSNLALCFALTFGQGRQSPVAVESQQSLVTEALDGEAF